MSNSLLIHARLHVQRTLCEGFPELQTFLPVHVQQQQHTHTQITSTLAYWDTLETTNDTFTLSLCALF